MRLVILSSCTAQKAVRDDRALTLADFQLGRAHVSRREEELAGKLSPAEDLYRGQQHVRLMRGVRAVRAARPRWEIDLQIASAGYGIVPGDRRLAPYECSFNGMSLEEIRDRARQLRLRSTFRRVLSAPYDLALILLGETYLLACDPDDHMVLGGPTLVICGRSAVGRVPHLPNIRVLPISEDDTRRFSAGLVGLKGEVAGRVLALIGERPNFAKSILDPDADVLGALDEVALQPERTRATRPPIVANPVVQNVIGLPSEGWRKPHHAQARYFIPEWHDRIDPDYDFVHDRHSSGSPDWSNEIYAHQLFNEPNYDGILVSRSVLNKEKRQHGRIYELGIHKFLRVPPEFPVMGDCGAFSYVNQPKPPYSTSEVVEYYTALGFDYGVSVDHLVFAATRGERQARYELTVRNASKFIREHQRRGLKWQPVGAVQGWDPEQYAEAAYRYVQKMGYESIALGGLARSSTAEIVDVVRAVHASVPADTRVHLFGVARLEAMPTFAALGVTSVDSASALRAAWLNYDKNFLSDSGWYSAIRIPRPEDSPTIKRVLHKGVRLAEQVHRLEESCLNGVQKFSEQSRAPGRALIDVLTTYEALAQLGRYYRGQGARADTLSEDAIMRLLSSGALLEEGRDLGVNTRIERTLKERPWKRCQCAICSRIGIQVVIFRGNNRNRRRGFHNTYVFYRLLQQVLAGETFRWLPKTPPAESLQPPLFEYTPALDPELKLTATSAA